MALLANLQFGDNDSKRYAQTYLVTEVHSHVYRRHNKYLPDATSRCERLEITVVTPGKQDLTLIEWYTQQTCLSGRIVVELAGSSQSSGIQTREIYFNNAVCFKLAESYSIDKASRRLLSLAFEAAELKIDDVEFHCD